MDRQSKFEQLWADRHGIAPADLIQYRFKEKDGYRLPAMAAHYRTFCETLDSVEIRLSNGLFLNIAGENVEAYEVSGLVESFKAAGLRVAQ